MTIVLGILLLINAVYNVVVWPRFFKRVVADPRSRDENGQRTTFFRVHAILVAVALVLAAVSAVFGIIAFFI